MIIEHISIRPRLYGIGFLPRLPPLLLDNRRRTGRRQAGAKNEGGKRRQERR
jgi:hypothetical protein